jgi:hypothetical protein
VVQSTRTQHRIELPGGGIAWGRTTSPAINQVIAALCGSWCEIDLPPRCVCPQPAALFGGEGNQSRPGFRPF